MRTLVGRTPKRNHKSHRDQRPERSAIGITAEQVGNRYGNDEVVIALVLVVSSRRRSSVGESGNEGSRTGRAIAH
jgi:hypothetical protein